MSLDPGSWTDMQLVAVILFALLATALTKPTHRHAANGEEHWEVGCLGGLVLLVLWAVTAVLVIGLVVRTWVP